VNIFLPFDKNFRRMLHLRFRVKVSIQRYWAERTGALIPLNRPKVRSNSRKDYSCVEKF
jgi:hypothetical protein